MSVTPRATKQLTNNDAVCRGWITPLQMVFWIPNPSILKWDHIWKKRYCRHGQDVDIRAGPSPIWWVSLEGGDLGQRCILTGMLHLQAKTGKALEARRGAWNTSPEHLPYSEPALLTPEPWTSSLQDRETLTPTVKVTTWWYSLWQP